jgi:hypothetical protein
MLNFIRRYRAINLEQCGFQKRFFDTTRNIQYKLGS